MMEIEFETHVTIELSVPKEWIRFLLVERAVANGNPLEFELLRAVFDTDEWW